MEFISKYSNNKSVTAAQYITEIICERKAQKDGSDLHYRFWTLKKWAKFFRDQIATANKLLKDYDARAIIKALHDPKAKSIYSLRAPFLKDIIITQQKILETTNTTLTQNFERKENINHRVSGQNKKNIISKIKDIENGS